MIGCRLRITTLLLLLATIICSVRVEYVEAEVVPARMLRNHVQQDDADLQPSATTTSFESNSKVSNTKPVDDTNALAHAATEPSHKGSDSGPEAAGPGHEAPDPGLEAAGSDHKAAGSGDEAAKPAHEAPTFMMFMGPAIAGVLAIVLIGSVIAFKNRKSK
ncbi:hypothetical protein KXD40_009477 [Peronospora effusa]|uniref:RxLR effector candidate protein n=1 Tax=Peronospora effusa TaxID=542832 RepID=A0A3M6VF23_9STRA|nr:hypothetical protein DD238_007254 [Peronospora effusa]RQM13242.1 hypothetical protein DD237_007741 [Peronospora effusa]UIZ28515.1 hypothetical protein KXD40_009477 [Peronospora effusa]CAI5702662.1 unnamed protein product [Peronospora effusa]